QILNDEHESDDSDADPDFEVYLDSNSECGISEEEPENIEPEVPASCSVDCPPVASTSSADHRTAATESGTPSHFYVGRDKKTKWRKNLFSA
ncbi:hypothetical protein J6590_102198, partial [Homalodisca vitripennis]